MNKVILMGRLTRDPDVRYTNGENPMCVTRYTLAVDRRFKKEGEQNADFINCVSFGKAAEFAGKYFHQGIKIVIAGRIQTGSYTNRDGIKIYTTYVVVEEQDFAESKSASQGNSQQQNAQQQSAPEPSAEDQPPLEEGFMTIPDGVENELPFI